jgi:hypothetical protein
MVAHDSEGQNVSSASTDEELEDKISDQLSSSFLEDSIRYGKTKWKTKSPALWTRVILGRFFTVHLLSHTHSI